jgi:uncharacterized protein YjiS (DUF1127 family)
MSATTVNVPSHSGRLGSTLAKIRRAFEARKIERNTYLDLSKLSDRELNDIGIYRGDIARIARDAGHMLR